MEAISCRILEFSRKLARLLLIYVKIEKVEQPKDNQTLDYEFEEMKKDEEKQIEWFAIVKPITNLVTALNKSSAEFALHFLK